MRIHLGHCRDVAEEEDAANRRNEDTAALVGFAICFSLCSKVESPDYMLGGCMAVEKR